LLDVKRPARWRLIALLPCLWMAGAAAEADAPATPAAAIEAESPRKGYLLFRSRYEDPQALRPYGRAVIEVAAKFGGRFIVLADAPEPLEGTPDTRRVVIMEFPSLAAARAFWTSAEYGEVKKLRAGLAGEIDAILFEGR
jgi:uncharacterized protein (DUF1330 family)